MSAKKAYAILVQKITTGIVDKCYEYNDIYVFRVVPKNYDGKLPLLGNLFSVHKKTGIINPFTPMMITHEDYTSGKEIKDFNVRWEDGHSRNNKT